MLAISKKYFDIFLTLLMVILLLIATVIYILNHENYYVQQLNFNDTTYNEIYLITEEIALILDTDVTELYVVNSNQIETDLDSNISYLSINFYVSKNKKEYQLKLKNNAYFITYIGDYKSDSKNLISLGNLLSSIRHIEIGETRTRIIMNSELTSSIRHETYQEQYLVDSNGIYLIGNDVKGVFMNIKRIHFLDDMWKVNDGVDFFLSINKN